MNNEPDKLKKLEAFLAERGIEYSVNYYPNAWYSLEIPVSNRHSSGFVTVRVMPEESLTMRSFLTTEVEVSGLTLERAVELLEMMAE